MPTVDIPRLPLPAGAIPARIRELTLGQPDIARRLVAARGALPLPPADLVLTLFILLGDSEPMVAEEAARTFDDLPPGVLAGALEAGMQPAVMDYVARLKFPFDAYRSLLERIVVHREVEPETLEFLAGRIDGDLLDLLSQNQIKLLSRPGIVWAIAGNPAALINTVTRSLEFLTREKRISDEEQQRLLDLFLRVDESGQAQVPLEKLLRVRPDGEIEFPDMMTRAAPEELEEPADEEAFRATPPPAMPDAAAAAVSSAIKRRLPMKEIISKMGVAERLRLAVRGDMEARGLLLRDKILLVAKAVLKSPRITKIEVERIAADRLMDTEILELVANNRNYTKYYSIKHELVFNPKTPLPLAIKLMHQLREPDVKKLSKSKAVPAALANVALQKMAVGAARRKRPES